MKQEAKKEQGRNSERFRVVLISGSSTGIVHDLVQILTAPNPAKKMKPVLV